MGFEVKRQRRTSATKNVERFRTAYGIGPGACCAIFRDLQATKIPAARIQTPNKVYFLVAMNWLATYKKENEIAGFFKVDEKTARVHIRIFVEAIAALKNEKIIWDDGGDEVFLLSVDGVHFNINEVRTEPDARWCSHKHKSAGLVYELAISIYKSNIVWIKGPFMAAKHDKTIFMKEGLYDKMPAGKKAIADRAYKGKKGRDKLAIRNPRDSDCVKEFKKRVRARHENLNARLKSFAILDNRFRHGYKKHKTVLEAVCVCVQYDIEDGHPLFDV